MITVEFYLTDWDGSQPITKEMDRATDADLAAHGPFGWYKAVVLVAGEFQRKRFASTISGAKTKQADRALFADPEINREPNGDILFP